MGGWWAASWTAHLQRDVREEEEEEEEEEGEGEGGGELGDATFSDGFQSLIPREFSEII